MPNDPGPAGTLPLVPFAEPPPSTGARGRGTSPLGMMMVPGPGAAAGGGRGGLDSEVPSPGMLSEAPALKPSEGDWADGAVGTPVLLVTVPVVLPGTGVPGAAMGVGVRGVMGTDGIGCTSGLAMGAGPGAARIAMLLGTG